MSRHQRAWMPSDYEFPGVPDRSTADGLTVFSFMSAAQAVMDRMNALCADDLEDVDITIRNLNARRNALKEREQ